MINLNTEKGAYFSDCGCYRFLLWRCWNVEQPKVLFIGLNPSTANASKDDATTRKIISLAKKNGFGGIILGNCFPFIATNPKNLNDFSFLEKNDSLLKTLRKDAVETVFAWGNFSLVTEKKRDEVMMNIFPQAKVLSLNKNGSPKHPLYVRLDVVLEKYQQKTNIISHA